MNLRLSFIFLGTTLFCLAKSSKLPRAIAEFGFDLVIYLPLQAFSSMEYALYRIWLPLSVYIRNQTRDKWIATTLEDVPDSVVAFRLGALIILRMLNIMVFMIELLGELSRGFVALLLKAKTNLKGVN